MTFLSAGCASQMLAYKSIYLSLFLGGLFGSIHHCAGMCGPFVVAQTTSGSGVLMRASGSILVPYHLGRMLTYILLGTLASMVAYPILNTVLGKSVITLLLAGAGILFLLHGLSVQTHFKLPFKEVISKFASGFTFQTSPLHKFALGTILGLLPCGLVFAAILTVSSLAHPFYAILGMIAFALGTLPMLIGIGFVSNTLMQKYKPLYTKFTKAMMIFNGFVLITLSIGKII